MKPVSYFLSLMSVFGLAASVLSGCVDDIKEPGGSLVVSPTEFNNVKGTGETLTINVESDLYWSVYAQDSDGKTVSWIEFDKTAGMGSDQILAIVKPSASERSCEIIIQADGSDIRAVVKVSQGKGTGEVAEGYEMPVYDIFDNKNDDDVSAGPANGFIDGNVFLFNNGMTITRLGGESAMAYEWKNTYYEIVLNTTGWDAEGAAWEVKIPVATALSGRYRLLMASRSGAGIDWNVLYSNNGETYTDTGVTYSTTAGSRWKTLFFEIGGENAVQAGGTLYLKFVPSAAVAADTYVTFESGLLLTGEYPEPAQLPEVGGKVLYTCGFDNCNTGAPYTLPVGYIQSATGSFDGTEYGMKTSGTVVSMFGSIRLGTASASATVTLPGMELLGDGTADVKVSFKSVLYQSSDYKSATEGKATSATEVRIAEGQGTVENGVVDGLNNETFVEKTVIVRGINKDTQIQIGSYADGADHRFYIDDIVVEVEGEISYPEVVERSISEVISEYGAGLQTGGSAEIDRNIKVAATVVSDYQGGNIEDGIVVVQDDAAGIAVSVAGAESFAAGDKVEMSLAGGKITRDAGYTLTLAEGSVNVIASGEEVVARTVPVASIKESENMYVAIENCQVSDTDLGKTWSGSTMMENTSKQSFSVNVAGDAAFAGSQVPSLSGTVCGIVRGGAVCPRNAEDLSGLVLDRFGEEGVELMEPVVNIINIPAGSAAAVADNLAIENNTLTFGGSGRSVAGARIELVGGTAAPDMKVGWQNKTNYFNNFIDVTYEGDGAYLLLSTPVSEEISGKTQVVFSLSSTTAAVRGTSWNIFWSKDGTDWTATETTYNNVNRTEASASAAANSFTMQNSTAVGITQSQFTVSAADRIQAGETIYFKIEPAEKGLAGTLRFAFGFYVSSATIVNTVMPDGDNVLAANNFETCAFGPDYMIGTIGYMAVVSNNTDAYSGSYLPAGWSAVSGNVRCGYAFFGTASGTGFGVTTPALTKIGEGTADIKVHFKACLYEAANGKQAINGIVVEVAEGEGTVGELVWKTDPTSDYFGWHECSVTVSGATAATRVFIGAGSQSGDKRFFLDDVIVTK